ncbi:hypothetical protein C4553_03355 [Candidatus Parcubacteria bacterium]|nr:MAG: hypothetical protein C4553_03355 [Candidatus Parcubacteria bacterium]
MKHELSKERVLGILETSCSFTKNTSGLTKRPRFVVKMIPQNKILLEAIREFLGVRPPVREYFAGGRHYIILTVTGISDLKTKIVPLLDEGLLGPKREKFEDWLNEFKYLKSPKT